MKKFFWICAILLLNACEKEVFWEFKAAEPLLVVDGMITNEKKAHSIRLNLSASAPNRIPSAVSGASVTISDGSQAYPFTEQPAGSGIYLSDSSLQGIAGVEYALTVVYNSTTYRAKAKMEPVQPLTPFQYVSAGGSNYKIGWVAEAYNNESAMYGISLDWSHVPGYDTLQQEKNHALLYYYSFGSISVNQLFAPNKEEVLFPAGTLAVEKKYSLSKEHSEYLRAIVSETEWKGGYFDVPSANAHGNISNGALGFFAACSVTEYKVQIK